MWKFKFFINFCLVTFNILRNYDKKLWMRYRKNGVGSQWTLPRRKLELKLRKESAGTHAMTKSEAQQWELINAFMNTDDSLLQEDLIHCSVNLITWITLLKINDPIEISEEEMIEITKSNNSL